MTAGEREAMLARWQGRMAERPATAPSPSPSPSPPPQGKEGRIPWQAHLLAWLILIEMALTCLVFTGYTEMWGPKWYLHYGGAAVVAIFCGLITILTWHDDSMIGDGMPGCGFIVIGIVLCLAWAYYFTHYVKPIWRILSPY